MCILLIYEVQVATLKYLAAHTNIPVPKIFAWDSDAANPVGAEYMIMEKVSARGVDNFSADVVYLKDSRNLC